MRKTRYSIALILITMIITIGGAAAVMAGNGMAALLPLWELMTAIEGEHLDPPGREALLRGAAGGMVEALDDPYAAYYAEEEYEAYLTRLSGQYEGIGVLVGQPDERGVTVVRVYEGSAAEAAGLRAGDVIIGAGGQPLGNLTLEEAAAHLRGEPGSVARIRVLRGEEEFTLEIVRERGTARRVHWEMMEDTGYIRIDMFSGDCVEEFRAALDETAAGGARALLIDLRNNPGGELEKVVDMLDMVLGEGVIVRVAEEEFLSDAARIDLPLAVLVNGNSASASEIFAGAVQQAGAGAVIGTRTYGKGVVQTTRQMRTNDDWLKMTTDEYILADGTAIHGVGVAPDIWAEGEEEQLGAGLEYLNETCGKR